MKIKLKNCPICDAKPKFTGLISLKEDISSNISIVWCSNGCNLSASPEVWNKIPRKEDYEAWAAWTEEVFWVCQGPLKHGGEYFPGLTDLPDNLYYDLFQERTWKIGGDDLHCIREQLYMEYDIPALQEKLWPTK